MSPRSPPAARSRPPRSRRLMRLRSTAPPAARGTANPKRGSTGSSGRPEDEEAREEERPRRTREVPGAGQAVGSLHGSSLVARSRPSRLRRKASPAALGTTRPAFVAMRARRPVLALAGGERGGGRSTTAKRLVFKSHSRRGTAASCSHPSSAPACPRPGWRSDAAVSSRELLSTPVEGLRQVGKCYHRPLVAPDEAAVMLADGGEWEVRSTPSPTVSRGHVWAARGDEGTHSKWFAEVRGLELDDDTLVLVVPSEFTRDWIESDFLGLISGFWEATAPRRGKRRARSGHVREWKASPWSNAWRGDRKAAAST